MVDVVAVCQRRVDLCHVLDMHSGAAYRLTLGVLDHALDPSVDLPGREG